MKHRLQGFPESRIVLLDRQYLNPGPSQKHRNHSPDGFNWGYGGSGPAQLALAIMLALTGRADGYQDFKFKFIAGLPQDTAFDVEFDVNEVLGSDDETDALAHEAHELNLDRQSLRGGL